MIKVLSLVATCMAGISFSGFAAEAPSIAAANPYEQNVVRLSKITVAPEYLDQYKAFAAEVGRESMKREPGVRVLYSMQEKKEPHAVCHSRNLCKSRGLPASYPDASLQEVQGRNIAYGDVVGTH